jgi:rhodanese-related sulfurtransferase
MRIGYRSLVVLVAVASLALARQAKSQGHPTIFEALLGEPGPTPEISTAELRTVLTNRSATVLDARPYMEYATSHIPGAQNVAPKPGVSPSMYVSDVAEVGRLVGDRKDAPLVLYCNGPFCGKSKRLAEELLKAGFTNVKRYQLGIPMWRAIGGTCQIELDGVRHILDRDKTAVIIDSRESEAFANGSLPGARNIPRSGVLEGKDVGEVRRAKDDGRLPMEDHNTRVIVIGTNAESARYVAEAIAREAFHNVSYVAATMNEARAALQK